MVLFYPSSDRKRTSAEWGDAFETFFPSKEEKYLRFGNLVQLTTSRLGANGKSAGMILHRNIEVVDIIISGEVGFQDSKGVTSSFPANTVQVTSGGSGLYHMELNIGERDSTKLQIAFLPDSLNTVPTKSKAIYDLNRNSNTFVELISPNNESSLSVRQNAAVLFGSFDEDQHVGYSLNNKDIGLFVYIEYGSAVLLNKTLHQGDSVGIIDEGQLLIHTVEKSRILLIEVSMNE